MFIIQDVQLANRGETRWIFLSAKVSEDKHTINFRAEKVKFDPVKEENITLAIETFTDAKFSRWWGTLRAKGWKFCS